MITRRAFLKSGIFTMFSASLGGTPFFLRRTALAAENDPGYRRRKTLVTIFQRGAMDGLMAVPPLDDPLFAKLRPTLAMDAARAAGENATLDLNGKFGLHPGFSPLLPFFQENRLAIVHGVGSPNPTRSHFDAQDYMESGTPFRKGTSSGWLNRAVGELGHEGTPFRAVAMTQTLPRSLYGSEPALAIADLQDYRINLPGMPTAVGATEQNLEALYRQTTQDLLQSSGNRSFEAMKTLSATEIRNYRPANGAKYPKTPLGQSLRQIALLIKAGVGLEVAFAESGGWDTHVQQGTTRGAFARRAEDLAQSIAAFWRDLGETWQDNVMLMTMTEFGRTVRENGSGGTDHGRASCMFVLGNRVDGGKVHGSIPDRLEVEALADGRDLPVTTDFRAVFADVAGEHLNISGDDVIFPGWEGQRLALIKS